MSNTNRIRELNDAFRTTFAGGRILLTSSVNALPEPDKKEVLARVQSFQAFDTDNDPHHEHDFGAFEIAGDKFFFKIDYYAPDMKHGSEDPADASKTTRVLTVMCADEY